MIKIRVAMVVDHASALPNTLFQLIFSRQTIEKHPRNINDPQNIVSLLLNYIVDISSLLL